MDSCRAQNCFVMFCVPFTRLHLMPDEACIQETREWIRQFVIQLNLCPFAKREMDRDSVHFAVSHAIDTQQGLIHLEQELNRLTLHPSIATSVLIFSDGFQDFFQYLDFVDEASIFLEHTDRTCTYQLATFHPDYFFANTLPDEVSNYSNRSPYPLLHLLREEHVEKAISYYGDTESIPENNIRCLQKLGLDEVKKIISAISSQSKV